MVYEGRLQVPGACSLSHFTPKRKENNLVSTLYLLFNISFYVILSRYCKYVISGTIKIIKILPSQFNEGIELTYHDRLTHSFNLNALMFYDKK